MPLMSLFGTITNLYRSTSAMVTLDTENIDYLVSLYHEWAHGKWCQSSTTYTLKCLFLLFCHADNFRGGCARLCQGGEEQVQVQAIPQETPEGGVPACYVSTRGRRLRIVSRHLSYVFNAWLHVIITLIE